MCFVFLVRMKNRPCQALKDEGLLLQSVFLWAYVRTRVLWLDLAICRHSANRGVLLHRALR